MNTKMHKIIPATEQNSKVVLFSKSNKIRKIKVNEKCDMCRKHIEKAVLSVHGVLNARWGIKSGKLILKYKDGKTNLNAIERVIADAGHDTPNYKGKMEFYTDMPQCCKYREELVNSGA